MRPFTLRSALTAAAVLCAGAATAAPSKPAVGAHSLASSLHGVLAGGDLGRSQVGMRVVEADTGRVVFDHNPDLPLKPASNMKVMTSAAALSLLRPEYVFSTVFLATARPSGGVLAGDLYIKGFGSPGLSGDQWWLMAREMKARGIDRIEGDLVGDDSYFDSRDRPEGWPSPSEDAFYNAPVSALSADFSAVTIVVRPGREGAAPDVVLTPFSSFFKVSNRALTRGASSNLRVGRQFDGTQNTIIVDGHISSRSAPSVSYRSVEQPTLYALAAFREAASKEGIVIKGPSRRGAAPPTAVRIYEHESKPLSDLVRIMNKFSNNYMAESFLKTLGAETAGPPGTSEKGASAVLSFLEGLGAETRGLVLADGSGLSHADRLTASSLTAVLLAMYRDFESSFEFITSLPIGGVDGTLDRRMVGGPAQRRIRAKTGHLNGVSSLSGYAFTQQGKALAFAILVNAGRDSDVWKVRRGIDRLCSAMVESELPDLDAPAPAQDARLPGRQGGR
ncbi:MAG TPA: D-alanyl-D-alanine carboxypeptidase/D-alanyl-D-alanine-endopeptidase [Candidatus Polarisedimenticolia bacterium]|nr:D-alanyl-D-alanine carboxypeptidase/D-alanyl-D-alanine-endopeptidase [Candidatus Polarisedimenticolia bacterium]